MAQEKLGAPLTTVHLQPIAIRSCYEPAVYPRMSWFQSLPIGWRGTGYRFMDVAADHLYAGALNAFRRNLGLPPIKRLFGQWWHSPESTLAQFPPWYAPP